MKDAVNKAIEQLFKTFPAGSKRRSLEGQLDGEDDQVDFATAAQEANQSLIKGADERLDSSSKEFYTSIDSGKRAQSAIYQSLWLKEITRKLLPHRSSSKEIFVEEAVHEATRKLMVLLLNTMRGLALEFNGLIADIPAFAALRVSLVEVNEVRETPNHEQQERQHSSTPPPQFLRSRISTSTWSLSMRGSAGRIEFFLVPASELFLFSQSETPARLKSVVQMYDRSVPDGVWMIDGLPADPDELYYMIRTLFKTLLFTSAQGLREQVLREQVLGSSMLLSLEGDALKSAVTELLLAGRNMAQKIVNQHEEIQTRIARDLHDAVIADIMTLKREISSESPPESERLVSSLTNISQQLREICHDLAPRDLIDWGLATVIEDMLERVAQRTGMDCSFSASEDLPELPYPVQLHIYRIVQESLNNVEKYAQAKRIYITLELDDGELMVQVRDDGKGFNVQGDEARKSTDGGTGLSGIKERAEMIRCFFPASMTIESQPGAGSTTTLNISLSSKPGR